MLPANGAEAPKIPTIKKEDADEGVVCWE